jgi:hypothetical protein
LFDNAKQPLSSSDVYIAGNLIMVKVSSPFLKSLFVGAYSQTSSQTEFIPLQIKVCGFEQVSLEKKYLEKSYSKNGAPSLISQKDLLKNFRVNDTDCPIENLSLVQAENP